MTDDEKTALSIARELDVKANYLGIKEEERWQAEKEALQVVPYLVRIIDDLRKMGEGT